ncbi:MAG: hypothetical protein ABI488_03385 [Polyangiaceae bacterium]
MTVNVSADSPDILSSNKVCHCGGPGPRFAPGAPRTFTGVGGRDGDGYITGPPGPSLGARAGLGGAEWRCTGASLTQTTRVRVLKHSY